MPTPKPRQAHRRAQGGAALLTAMVIVTLVTTIAAAMVWQQWRSVQVEAAERSLVQSQWMLSGALDYGRMILRADAPEIDHLGEPWALGLAETRVSALLAADRNNTDDAADAFLSGQLVDATSRYNLYNLVVRNANSPGDVDPQQLAILKRLCAFSGVPATVADGIGAALRQASLATIDEAEAISRLGGPEARRAAGLLPQNLDQLVWLGIDAGTIERLRPFVTVLPAQSGPTPINVNTASREVLAAVIESLDLGRADRLVQVRQRTPFKSPDDIRAAVGVVANLPDDTVLAYKTDYFEIRGRLRLEDRVLTQNYLVQRQNRVVTVLLEERVAGVQMLAGRGEVNP